MIASDAETSKGNAGISKLFTGILNFFSLFHFLLFFSRFGGRLFAFFFTVLGFAHGISPIKEFKYRNTRLQPNSPES
jgi:hypothetical protein